MSRKLIRYFAGVAYVGTYTGVTRVTICFGPNRPVYAFFPGEKGTWVGGSDGVTEKKLNLLGYFKTQREALLHAQTKLKSHTRRLQKWRKENREHLAAVKELLGECK